MQFLLLEYAIAFWLGLESLASQFKSFVVLFEFESDFSVSLFKSLNFLLQSLKRLALCLGEDSLLLLLLQLLKFEVVSADSLS